MSGRGRSSPIAGRGPPQQRSGGNSNFWQVLAIVALVAATAGWTTVAVLALRPGPSAVAEAPVDESFDPEATDDTEVPPVADTHDAPELEALLPATLYGTTLEVQSWDGDGYLTDDPWSTSMTAFLTAACKTPADLHVAQSYDPNQAIDASVGVYRSTGSMARRCRTRCSRRGRATIPEMKVSQVTLGGKDVTKGDFGEDTSTATSFVRGDSCTTSRRPTRRLRSRRWPGCLPRAASPATDRRPAGRVLRPAVRIARAGAVSELTRRTQGLRCAGRRHRGGGRARA